MKKEIILVIIMVLVVAIGIIYFTNQDIFRREEAFDKEWPQYGQNAGHSGYSTSTAPTDPEVKWSYDSHMSRDIIATYGRVFVCRTSYPNAELVCLDADTGDELWVVSENASNISGPVVANRKVVVIYSREGKSPAFAMCYNVDEGKLLWNSTLKPTMEMGSSHQPVILNNKVYVVSKKTWVHCLNLDDGKKMWQTGLEKIDGMPIINRSPPTLVDGRIYFSSVTEIQVPMQKEIHYILHCFDAKSGKELWRKTDVKTKTMYGYRPGSQVVAVDEFMIYSTEYPLLRCYDVSDPSRVQREWSESVYSIVAGHDGLVYAPYEDAVICYSDEGRVVWSTDLVGAASLSLSGDGKVVCVVRGSDLEPGLGGIGCLDVRGGDLEWFLFLNETVRHSPVLAYDRIYLTTEEHIICIE